MAGLIIFNSLEMLGGMLVSSYFLLAQDIVGCLVVGALLLNQLSDCHILLRWWSSVVVIGDPVAPRGQVVATTSSI